MTPMAPEKPVLPVERHLLDGAMLAKLGIRIRNRWDSELECLSCGERWTPYRYPDGRLAPGYWKCPNRCNW